MRAPLTAVAVAAAVALSGCSTADTAAVVNGEVISEREAQTAARQVNEAFSPQTPLDTRTAITSLITAPIINEVAAQAGKGISAASARTAMPNLAEPAEATIELVRANFALQNLSDTERAQIFEELGKAEITVNPRYGSFDRDGAKLEPSAQNWIAQPEG